MSFPKIFLFLVVGFFGLIAVAAVIKSRRAEPLSQQGRTEEIVLATETLVVEEAPAVQLESPIARAEIPLPDADRMEEFFNTLGAKLPIVETIIYSRKVTWQPEKAAWIADYASHFSTSRHFIARSLNGCRDYEDQRVANGDRFNVFRQDRPVSFHLVVDTSRCKMWVYYLDELSQERALVKTYVVGLGRKSDQHPSGLLTPHGIYRLGDNIAVYREGSTSLHQGQRVEMRQVFGTRWIPFGEEVAQCTAPCRGLGLHGCPWRVTGEEDRSGLGEYASDGCIRLSTEDMEELFAVIITKQTTLYLVSDFFNATLPGRENHGAS
jgi:hypothetical protein